jgi:hypothetical protein
MSQHNPYVDKLVAELKIVTQRLEILGEQRVPEFVRVELWTEIIQQVGGVPACSSSLYCLH